MANVQQLPVYLVVILKMTFSLWNTFWSCMERGGE